MKSLGYHHEITMKSPLNHHQKTIGPWRYGHGLKPVIVKPVNSTSKPSGGPEGPGGPGLAMGKSMGKSMGNS